MSRQVTKLSGNGGIQNGSSTLRLHDKVYLAELENILTRMTLDMKDLDPEYSKVVDDHFWDLI